MIDKQTTGTDIITGTKVRYKAKDAISRMVKAKATTPGGSLQVVRKVSDSDDDIADTRPILYHSRIELEVWLIRT